MMADVPAAAREIAVADSSSAWQRLGFAVGADGTVVVGGVRVRTGRGRFSLAVAGLGAGRRAP